jgi:hypothetical protein
MYYILIFLSLIVITLAYLRKLYPYNRISTTISSIILILSIVGISFTPQTITTSTRLFDIETLTPGWGDINGTWNDNIITFPVVIASSGFLRSNRSEIRFRVTPNPPPLSSSDDRTTIHVKIENYSSILYGKPFLYKSGGSYYANITDPSGVESGNDYRSDYTFSYTESGLFTIRIKLNGGQNSVNRIGNIIDIPITFYDDKDTYEYIARYVCVGT